MTRDDGELQDAVRSAVDQVGIRSAVLFVLRPGSFVLELAAAAGIDGPALEGLTAAVRNPDHPISRTIVDEATTYDVRPTAPGGPALRSHLPLVASHAGRRTVVGVLAVAHQDRLTPETRRVLAILADTAAASLDPTDEPGDGTTEPLRR